MGDRIDKRKSGFKSKNLNATDRIRKESEHARKEKRSTNVLAKRLRADPTASDESNVVYTEATVNNAIVQVKVSFLTWIICVERSMCLTLEIFFRVATTM